jgi:hypothetical protein
VFVVQKLKNAKVGRLSVKIVDEVHFFQKKTFMFAALSFSPIGSAPIK